MISLMQGLTIIEVEFWQELIYEGDIIPAFNIEEHKKFSLHSNLRMSILPRLSHCWVHR